MASVVVDRGSFIRLTSSLGAGLALAINLPGCGPSSNQSSAKAFEPNAWVRIAPDDTVTVMLGKSEMGQGVAMGLPTILADELDASLAQVRIEFAPPAPQYADLKMGLGPIMVTGGSTSIADFWMVLRTAGATARAMLVAAAAKQWGVDPATLRTSNGVVHHDTSGKSASYGSFADA